jgi:NAD-dependent deacetylase
MEPSVDSLAALLRKAQCILVFTGAGVSTGSGIPDFRGPQGVWKKRKPVYYQDFMSSESARIEHWEFKLEGWPGFKAAKPNACHHAIVALEHAHKLEALVTQNIDGLHTSAGTSTGKLVELHGTNMLVECQACGARSDPDPWFEQFSENRKPPRCSCGGFLKPATISFGQNLRAEDLARAESAAHHCDLVIALGSTLSVYPAANIPLLAVRHGAPYAIVNQGATDHYAFPEVTLRLEGNVVELFPLAVQNALSPG